MEHAGVMPITKMTEKKGFEPGGQSIQRRFLSAWSGGTRAAKWCGNERARRKRADDRVRGRCDYRVADRTGFFNRSCTMFSRSSGLKGFCRKASAAGCMRAVSELLSARPLMATILVSGLSR